MDPRYDTLTDGLGVVVMKSDISGRGTSHSLRYVIHTSVSYVHFSNTFYLSLSLTRKRPDLDQSGRARRRSLH